MPDQMGVFGPTNYRLPPELVDKIVANLNNDRYTLSSLALVCGIWLPPSRSRLLDRIRIAPNNQKCDKILDRPSAAGYIRHVAFILAHFPHSKADGRDELEYLLGVLKRMEQSDTYLKSLTITFDRRPNFKPYRQFFEFLSMAPGFSDIVELNVMVGGNHLHDFVPFICSFPRLKKLSGHLYHAAYSNESPDHVLTCNLPTSLETLQFNIPAKYVEAVRYLDKWLLSHPPRAISDLTISAAVPG
ncbi:hypothetical protein L218DRAFT_1034441 [Marasmius fiardii PR-910]|nr:hypothetical protein L218DRAFT_1034441 [Marasmius fiardii PR-910]